jgi:hypothetical protein
MASTELRPRTGEATTRQRLLVPAFIHLRPSPTRFLQPSLTRSGAESLDGPGLLDCPGPLDSPGSLDSPGLQTAQGPGYPRGHTLGP